MMHSKTSGRARVHKVLARAGYGKGGASKAAEGAEGQTHDGLAKHLSAVESEVHAEGGKPKMRLDKKPRKH